MNKFIILSYGERIKQFYAVKDVNSEILEGEFVVILRQFVVGKLTVLNMISRIKEPLNKSRSAN